MFQFQSSEIVRECHGQSSNAWQILAHTWGDFVSGFLVEDVPFRLSPRRGSALLVLRYLVYSRGFGSDASFAAAPRSLPPAYYITHLTTPPSQETLDCNLYRGLYTS